MAHDDSYPSNYVTDLVAALEMHPDAVLAFGRVRSGFLRRLLPTFPFVPPPIDPQAEWSVATAVRLLTLWQLWIAFPLGLYAVRLSTSQIYIFGETYGNIRADICWVFGLGLKGRLCYVSSTSLHQAIRAYRFKRRSRSAFGDLARALTRSGSFART